MSRKKMKEVRNKKLTRKDLSKVKGGNWVQPYESSEIQGLSNQQFQQFQSWNQ